jgi:hypothetical protein
MKMPGFDADVSLYKTSENYRYVGSSATRRQAIVVPSACPPYHKCCQSGPYNWCCKPLDTNCDTANCPHGFNC